MTVLKITQQKIDALEFQAEQAYQSLKRAFDTMDNQDVIYANQLYSTVMRDSIHTAVRDGNFIGFHREKSRGRIADRYILQYVLGSALSSQLESMAKNGGAENSQLEPVQTEVTIDGTRSEIDKKRGDYRMLRYDAGSVARAGKLQELLTLIEYVRENILKPTVQ